MDNNIFWGIGLILFGIYSVWSTQKNPTKGRDIWQLDIKGYVGGVGCVVFGIIILLKALIHK